MKYVRIKDYYCDYETQVVPLNYELIADKLLIGKAKIMSARRIKLRKLLSDILTCFADDKPFVEYDNNGNKLSEKYEVKINGFLIKVVDKQD